MKLCCFKDKHGEIRVGLVTEDLSVVDLTPAGIHGMQQVLESDEPIATLDETGWQKLPRNPLAEVSLCAPLERQEVWAAGVTYLRSKTARMEESNFSATAYDRVYEAERPELFFKSLGEKVVGPEEPVGIRRDARWSVPEPELALVMNSRGKVVGCTIGNDMSSRDIEGENLLYLPQAKIYEHLCPGALAPARSFGSGRSRMANKAQDSPGRPACLLRSDPGWAAQAKLYRTGGLPVPQSKVSTRGGAVDRDGDSPSGCFYVTARRPGRDRI
jgi:2-dehydro-3-deoxy-D-arabinonate dehydratase